LRGLEYRLWMYCLLLKFEDDDYLPGEREAEGTEKARSWGCSDNHKAAQKS